MFTTTVQDTNTIYYFCGFASHCQNGMWGTIYVVGGPAPPPSATSSTNSTTNSTNSTVTTTPSILSKSNAANFAGDFKLVTFATIIVFTLFKYLV
ncbi:hypothetical protein C1645_787752 [Glomus cerebriforme]|uniref:Phytocyanin domain-containing protein n=1 Tax=Glomus cerebriforme TaxID=658196 RepID=A0A397SFF8_9GLOM|nr:hypothetical protein C1645_787752 [Glomus cerebriforme]